MPKQTFFNLELSRQETIIEAAINEFSQRPFEQASLTRIVENSGIAKGSMYQYFHDKLDLYLYIVDLAYEKKRVYLSQAFQHGNQLFDTLEAYYRQSYLFANEHPLLHQVANQYWDSRADVLQGNLEKGRLSRSEDFAERLKDALRSGQINSDLDPEAVFFVYHEVGKGLIDSFEQGRDDNFLKAVLDVLRYGLEVREEE